MSELAVVVVASLATALATGLGALPLAGGRTFSRKWLGITGGVTAGIMLAASFRLINEGLQVGPYRTIAGTAAGALLIWFVQRFLKQDDEDYFEDMAGGGRKALLVLGVMTLHSFAEGIGVGVSFGGTAGFGIFIAAAIAVHNIPEGIAISLVMVPKGMPVWKAALYSIFSSLPQPLVAIPAYLFVTAFQPFLPVGLGIAAGAMIWMVVAEILPDALCDMETHQVAIAATLAAAAMVLMQVTLSV
ncbi:MAG: ZIP family metal transporter [Spirochaetota bacterium]